MKDEFELGFTCSSCANIQEHEFSVFDAPPERGEEEGVLVGCNAGAGGCGELCEVTTESRAVEDQGVEMAVYAERLTGQRNVWTPSRIFRGESRSYTEYKLLRWALEEIGIGQEEWAELGETWTAQGQVTSLSQFLAQEALEGRVRARGRL